MLAILCKPLEMSIPEKLGDRHEQHGNDRHPCIFRGNIFGTQTRWFRTLLRGFHGLATGVGPRTVWPEKLLFEFYLKILSNGEYVF